MTTEALSRLIALHFEPEPTFDAGQMYDGRDVISDGGHDRPSHLIYVQELCEQVW